MGILRAGDKVREGSFINSSEKNETASNDNDRVPRLEQVAGEDAKVHGDFLPKAPTIQKFEVDIATRGGGDSQFDVTNPSGTTFRYTWDGTGTNPNINSTNFPVGAVVQVSGRFNSNNNGTFVITASDTNYFEVTNASGVVESDKILSDGYIAVSKMQTWTKPADLKYAVIELVGGGAGGQTTRSDNDATVGAGGGGYAKKLISASDLGSTEDVMVGVGGFNGYSSSSTNISPGIGWKSEFGSHFYGTGGNGQSGGVGVDGDINIYGDDGGAIDNSFSGSEGSYYAGYGGGSFYGPITPGGSKSTGVDGKLYGSGASGSGAPNGGSLSNSGGKGGHGIVIITEYYA